MKFIIKRELLLKSLSNVSKVFNSKTLLPVLNNYKFSLRREKLEILGYNGETIILDSIDTIDEYGEKVFQYTSTGECLIPNRFLEILRKLTGENISVDCIDDSILSIDDGNTSFKLNTVPTKEYPYIPLELSTDSVEVNAKEFGRSVQQVAFASSNKDTTNILTAVNIFTKDRKIVLSATDGARLSRKTIDIGSVKEYIANVPSKVLVDVARICETYDTMVIGFEQKKIYFRLGSMIIFSTLVAGDYPNLNGILASKYTIDLNTSAKEIISALDRVSLLFIDKQTSAKFKISASEFKITSKAPQFGSVVENITNYSFNSQAFEINVDCDYITQAIRAIGKENITFKFTGETKPLFVVSEDEPNLIQVITPLRVVH